MTADGEPLGSLCCLASVTLRARAEETEDAAALWGGGDSTCRGVAVADGLGSYINSGEAARFAVQQAAALAQSLEPASAAGLCTLFSRLRQDLRDEFGKREPPPDASQPCYGTTLLLGVETPTHLLAAYVGNGAIWHLRGNFDESAPANGLPWSSANYLRPHSLYRDGKEQLYNLIAFSEQFDRFPPTVIAVDKDPRFGDILLLCTDGVCSADRLLHGTDAQGDLWIKAEEPMVEFYACLGDYFSQPCGGPSLDDRMQHFLHGLKDRSLIEDDATLGLIVTGAAREYQRRKGS